jgi:type I restriction enzyme, S subunit
MSMSGGMTPSTNNADFWDGDIPWVTPKDMKTERITSSIDRLTEQALEETAIRLYPSGCVLIVVRGMILAHSFPVAVNDIPVTINQDMKIIETVLTPEYLAILLRGMSQLILSTVEEAGHGTKVLRTDIYKNIRLPIPPKDEQRAIVQHVQKISTETDQMMGYVKQAITKLKEYRAALITSAVTGKIDVRNVPIPACGAEETAHAYRA